MANQNEANRYNSDYFQQGLSGAAVDAPKGALDLFQTVREVIRLLEALPDDQLAVIAFVNAYYTGQVPPPPRVSGD